MYKIIRAQTQKELEQQVTEAMNEGYTPVGGPVIDRGFAQAIYGKAPTGGPGKRGRPRKADS